MTRQQEALALAEVLLADVELSRCKSQQLLLKAGRLARLLEDDEAHTWIDFELRGYPNDGSKIEQTWLRRMGRLSSDGKGYFIPLARVAAEADGQEQRLAAAGGMSLSGEMLIPATREHHQLLGRTAQAMSLFTSIEGNVIAAIYEFASASFYTLLFSGLQADLFATAQRETDARLAPLAGGALQKIESISERLRAGDPEAVSHALSTCRRLIDAVADALFPARDEPHAIGEVVLQVRKANVLNRLQAHVADSGASKGRRDRLRRTLNDLYDRASAGTHADVDPQEARYLFLQTYVVLGEVLSLAPDVQEYAP